MFQKTKLAACGLALLASVFIFVSCSAEGKSENKDFVAEVVDSLSSAVAETLASAVVEETAVEVDSIPQREPVKLVSQVVDMVVVEPRLYAVFDGGMVIYDFATKSQEIVRVDEKLEAVAFHGGKIYVGGTQLRQFNDSVLVLTDDQFDGEITCLFSYGYRILVGTTEGLYSTGILGHEQLMDDVVVSAMVADESGLWVGTAGQGLYRWDGEDFQKRYLLRDPALFDTINTLDFKHQHLYAGTNNGLHIYDGGRWETFTSLDGLPVNNVISIDASAWVVYVGTDAGMVSFFNGEFNPVKKVEEKKVNMVRQRNGKLVLATDYDGILLKSPNTLKTIVPPILDANISILSLIH